MTLGGTSIPSFFSPTHLSTIPLRGFAGSITSHDGSVTSPRRKQSFLFVAVWYLIKGESGRIMGMRDARIWQDVYWHEFKELNSRKSRNGQERRGCE